MPRVPAVAAMSFIPWADARWTRVPSPPGGGFEVARWEASIRGDACRNIAYGDACRVIAYRTKARGQLRLAVQGVSRAKTHSFTTTVYETYWQECGRPRATMAGPRPAPKGESHVAPDPGGADPLRRGAPAAGPRRL